LTDKELIIGYLSGHCMAWASLAGNFEGSKIASLEDLGKEKTTQEMRAGEPIIGHLVCKTFEKNLYKSFMLRWLR